VGLQIPPGFTREQLLVSSLSRWGADTRQAGARSGHRHGDECDFVRLAEPGIAHLHPGAEPDAGIADKHDVHPVRRAFLGLHFPTGNLPQIFYGLSTVIPVTYSIELERAVILRGAGLAEIPGHLVVLAGMGMALFGLGVVRFRRQTA